MTVATMGADITVSVVIPCFSEARWNSILDAVTSVQKQAHQPADVVVAVDHNPALARRLRATLPDVTVVDNDGGIRGASATRMPAPTPRRPLIAFLDDDEVAEPEWLSRLVAPLTDPAVIGTGGRYRPELGYEPSRSGSPTSSPG